jgi:hypothetical protein
MAFPVEDYVRINELYARQVWALDTGDVDGFVATFTADGVLDWAQKWEGKEALQKFGTRFLQTDVWLPGSQHVVSALLIDGSSSEATVRCYVTRTHRLASTSRNNCMVVWAGHHTSKVVKVNGEWLFKEQVSRAWEGSTSERVLAARGGSSNPLTAAQVGN